MDLKEQYDKIYRYCYFKVRRREMAEDITQETFLRVFEKNKHFGKEETLQYLYTVARNFCIDEYRRYHPQELTESLSEEVAGTNTGSSEEEKIVTQIAIRKALSELDEKDRELLLFRYVNEVPVSVIGSVYQMSRFAAYRKILQAAKNLKSKLGKEDFA